MKNCLFTATSLCALMASPSLAYTVYSDNDSSLEVGGRVEPRFNISDANKTNDSSSFDDLSRARLYIDAKTKVNEKVSVFGYYNVELTADSSDVDNRYLYAGVQTEFGALSYGIQDSAQVILTNVTDIMETFGGSASAIIGAADDELDNNFVYLATLPYDITVTANFIAADKAGNNTGGGSIFYGPSSGIQAGIGYVDGKQNDQDVSQLTYALGYNIGDLALGGVYVDGEVNDTDIYGYELSVQYTHGDFVGRYVYNFRATDDPSSQASTYAVNYNAIEGVYHVTDDFISYVGYEFNRLEGQENDDQLQAGIRYEF